MELSVIVVNYKTPQLLRQCLQSVFGQTSSIQFEVIVVDNDSADESETMVQQQFPQVVWLQMGYNAGFARANNAGLNVAKGAFQLLLNSDTIVLDNALEKTVDHFKTLPPQIGGLSCELLNQDGSHQNCTYYTDTGFSEVWERNSLVYLLRKGKKRKPSEEIRALKGAFLMVRKAAVEKAGMLDPDFFLYAEEVEWSHRIRKAGFQLAYWNGAAIIHLGGGSDENGGKAVQQQISPIMYRQRLLSLALLFLKNEGRGGLLYYFLINKINFLINFLFLPLKSAEGRQEFWGYNCTFFSNWREYWELLLLYSSKTGKGKRFCKVIPLR